MEKSDFTEVIFYIRSLKDCEYWRGCLRGWYSDIQLDSIRDMIDGVLSSYQVKVMDEEGMDVTDVWYAKALNGLKGNLVDFLAVVFSHADNILAFYHVLPDSGKKLWDRMLHSYYVAEKDAEQLVGRKVISLGAFEKCTVGDNAMAYYDFFACYKNNGKDWNSEFYFYFYPAIYAAIVRALGLVDDQPMKGMEQLPDDEGLEISDFENDIFVDVNVVRSLYLQGLYSSKPTKLIPTVVKKALQSLSLKEFSLSPLMEDVTYMRSQFVVSAMAMMNACYSQMIKTTNTKDQDVVKAMVEKLQYQKQGIFEILLPCISGIKKKDLESCMASRIFTRIFQLLKNCDEGWLSMECIDRQMMRMVNDYRNPLLLIAPSKSPDNHYIFNRFSMMAVNADRQMHQMGLAMVHSFIAYLASLGCATVAYRDANRKDASPYDCIRYFKLNALGRYVFGISPEYTPPSVHLDKEYFELDDQRLIVRSIVDDNPYLHVLYDIAHPIYGGRFEMTSRSFLAHCSNEKDVEYKISVFHQYVSSELPAIWQDFFSKIKQHCKPLKAVMPQSFKVYKLQSDNQELMQLMFSDAKLKSYILRCEDYYIMVKSACLLDFEERMRELGYLL